MPRKIQPQTTLILLKGDTIQRGLIGQIVTRYENKGLKIVGMQMLQPTREQVEAHYVEHKKRTFFNELVQSLITNPVIALALEGSNAIQVVRNMHGLTDPSLSPPGTIRGDLGLEPRYNLVHASDSEENAQRELRLWLGKSLIQWQQCQDPFIYEYEFEL